MSKQVFHAFRLKSGIFLLPVQQAVVKTYMACAFGMEACKQYYKTRYVRMPDLLMDLNIARTEWNYRKTMAKYSNPVLLILDEWMLLKPTDTEQKDIFELLHRRRKKSSTIFCSQYVFEE